MIAKEILKLHVIKYQSGILSIEADIKMYKDQGDSLRQEDAKNRLKKMKESIKDIKAAISELRG